MKVKALYKCQGDTDEELSFDVDDIILDVMATEEDGWYVGRFGEKTGLFPSNYVVEISDESPTPSLPTSRRGTLKGFSYTALMPNNAVPDPSRLKHVNKTNDGTSAYSGEGASEQSHDAEKKATSGTSEIADMRSRLRRTSSKHADDVLGSSNNSSGNSSGNSDALQQRMASEGLQSLRMTSTVATTPAPAPTNVTTSNSIASPEQPNNSNGPTPLRTRQNSQVGSKIAEKIATLRIADPIIATLAVNNTEPTQPSVPASTQERKAVPIPPVRKYKSIESLSDVNTKSAVAPAPVTVANTTQVPVALSTTTTQPSIPAKPTLPPRSGSSSSLNVLDKKEDNIETSKPVESVVVAPAPVVPARSRHATSNLADSKISTMTNQLSASLPASGIIGKLAPTPPLASSFSGPSGNSANSASKEKPVVPLPPRPKRSESTNSLNLSESSPVPLSVVVDQSCNLRGSSSSLISSGKVVVGSIVPSTKENVFTVIHADDKVRYNEAFAKFDADKDGYLAADQVREIWGRSGLPFDELGKIWNLIVDATSPRSSENTARLSKKEFIVGLYLIDVQLLKNDSEALPKALDEGLKAELRSSS